MSDEKKPWREDDITTWRDESLAVHLETLRGKLAIERDEVLATHYRLRMEAVRAELNKRNEADIARRALAGMS